MKDIRSAGKGIVLMIDKVKMKKFIDWVKNNDGWCWDMREVTVNSFWEIVGDDRKELEKEFQEIEAEDLAEITGLFDDIEEKWPDRNMTKFLEKMRLKIIEAGYHT